MYPSESPTERIDPPQPEAVAHAIHSDAPDATPLRQANSAVVVANALGTAWATYQLYPNPRHRVGFDRAIQDLVAGPTVKYLEVGPRAFVCNRAEVAATHAGTSRVVDRLFESNIAALQFLASPSADDLVALFEVIRRSPEELDAEGGAAAVLRSAGIHSMRVIERRALIEEERDESVEPEEPGGSTDLSDYAGDPEALAGALIEASEGDPDRLTALVIDAYGMAHRVLDPQDIWEREEIVHTFVDMFFFFPTEYQIPLLSEILTLQDEAPFRMFLDQFASHELDELAPLLDSSAHPLLVEYARIATRAGELVDLIDRDTRDAAESVDTLVGKRIEAVLEGDLPIAQGKEHGAIGRLRNRRPGSEHRPAAGIGVLRGLLQLVEGDHDRHRILRIWAGKVAQAIRQAQLGPALDWLAAAPVDTSAGGSDSSAADVALAQAIKPEVTEALANHLHHDRESAEGHELLELLAPHVVDHLIELLAGEGDQGRRRNLIDMIVTAVRSDAAPVVKHLDDPRWYLVRNLAVILGRSQDPGMAEHVQRLTSHLDERVRRDALRALHALTHDSDVRPFIDGLSDPHESVRRAAATILRSSADPGLIPTLGGILTDTGHAEVKTEVIELLGELPGEDAKRLLAEAATGRVNGNRIARPARAAARRIMGDRR